ncbi:MAG: DUF5716 family protein [Lachnospiraceae bacterium]
MKLGSIIGYDLSEQYCQISYYNDEQHEPETLEVAVDNYQIPLMLGYREDTWIIGQEAKRLGIIKEGVTCSNILSKALAGEKICMGDKTFEAVWILAKFVEISLRSFEQISSITFTVSDLSIDLVRMLKGIAQRINIPKEQIYVQDYRESFCHYMFYQPKELWQYEAALFYCDRKEVKAYMLQQLKVQPRRQRETVVAVNEVASAQMEELASVYPVLNTNKAKDADARFKDFIQNVFEKKLVSSVFLTGEGFENNWYPNSLKVLCNGRRAFLGNNLYSKGACYTSYRKSLERVDAPIYLDETKLIEQICLKMRVNGIDEWYPIIPWGSRWYESDHQWEVLLGDTEDIEVHVESLATSETQVQTVSLNGLPKRKDYSLRLQVESIFLDERTCKIMFKDIGFGEFYPATDFQTEVTIHLGGNNEQFNSMS